MGRDKALLAHPEGGTWLESTLRRLAALDVPITLFSHHDAHRKLASALAPALGVRLELRREPSPREGPLLALARLMELLPGRRLLLCPVDMPWLEVETLRALVAQAQGNPARVQVAADRQRLQPLLGIYPADSFHRSSIARFTAAGGRSLLRWLETVEVEAVRLPDAALRNINLPGDRMGIDTPGSGAAASG